MDFDSLAYPEVIAICGVEYKGQRNMANGTVLVPYTETPDVGIGDSITQKSGSREIELRVTDVSFLPGGSLGVGTKHPHMLTLHVENVTAQNHAKKPAPTSINIGSISGQQIQVGNHNSQIVSITLQQLVEAVAKSGDEDAKSTLRKVFENSTVASLVGTGAAALLALL